MKWCRVNWWPALIIADESEEALVGATQQKEQRGGKCHSDKGKIESQVGFKWE